MLLAALDQTIIATAIRTIGREMVLNIWRGSDQLFARSHCRYPDVRQTQRHSWPTENAANRHLDICCRLLAPCRRRSPFWRQREIRQARRRLNSRAQTIVADTVAPVNRPASKCIRRVFCNRQPRRAAAGRSIGGTPTLVVHLLHQWPLGLVAVG
jgi:hypothetical protein